MNRDEHTTNRPTPVGSAFQETGMGDYLTRVAEAVRDACAAEAFMETTLAVEYVSAACPGEIISNMTLNNIDLPAIIASVPRPETVAWIIDWPEEPELGHYLAENPSRYGRSRGLYAEPVAAQVAVPDGLLTAADMKHLQRFAECAEDCDGHDVPKEDMKRLERAGAVRSLGFGRHETTAFGDAMLAAAPEAPQPDDDDFELTCPEPPARDDRKAIKRLSDAVSEICFQSGESEDEFTKWLADGGMLELLESSIKAMKLEKAVEAAGKKNAALVAAMQNIADEFVPGDEQKLYGTPTDVLDRIRSTAWAALASAKSGAE